MFAANTATKLGSHDELYARNAAKKPFVGYFDAKYH